MILSFALAAAIEWNPPAKYDKPYAGQMTLMQVDPGRIRSECRRLFRKHGLGYIKAKNGCAVHFNDGKSCTVIIIDRPANGTTPKNVFAHENGHCNGWPADHTEH